MDLVSSMAHKEKTPVKDKAFTTILNMDEKTSTKKFGVPVHKMSDYVENEENSEHRRKFMFGIPQVDLLLAHRDENGVVKQIGDPAGVHVLFSKAHQGKSLLLFKKMAYIQSQGLRVAIFVPEQIPREELGVLCKMSGLDMNNALIIFATTMEEVYVTIEKLAGLEKGVQKASKIDAILIDSITALTPKNMVKKTSDGVDMALQARTSGRFIGIINEQLAKKEIRLYAIFQYRDTMDQYTMEGSMDNYTGGNIWKHVPTVGLFVKRAAKSYVRDSGARFKLEGKEQASKGSMKGFPIIVKVVKTKVSGCIENTTTVLDFYFWTNPDKQGIDVYGGFFEFLIEQGIIPKEGKSKYILRDEEIIGIEKAKLRFIEKCNDDENFYAHFISLAIDQASFFQLSKEEEEAAFDTEDIDPTKEMTKEETDEYIKNMEAVNAANDATENIDILELTDETNNDDTIVSEPKVKIDDVDIDVLGLDE